MLTMLTGLSGTKRYRLEAKSPYFRVDWINRAPDI